MTVIHPHAWVVSAERDHEVIARLDAQSVCPPGAPGRAHTIPGQHQDMVPVQMHRVHIGAMVDNAQADQITLPWALALLILGAVVVFALARRAAGGPRVERPAEARESVPVP